MVAERGSEAMSMVTEENFNARILPLESVVGAMRDSSAKWVEEVGARMTDMEVKMEKLSTQLLAREGEVVSMVEKFTELELKFKDGGAGAGDDPKRRGSILGNPALRQLEFYSGEHAKYAKWRSKTRGIFVAEEELYSVIFRTLESPHQVELPPKCNGQSKYTAQIQKMAVSHHVLEQNGGYF